jgi:hypothetical protein
MSEAPNVGEQADVQAAARISFERLRERTDELELIISGLSLFALLAIPDALMSAQETYAGRMSLAIAAASAVALPVLSAICHTMALLLVLHLAVRAHWVGLIGLKAVFADGVRWERLQGLGPLTLAALKRRIPDHDQSIARADLIASTLFALVTFTALTLAVFGAWILLLFAVAVMFGSELGGANAFLNTAVGALFLTYVAAPLLRWLLDGVAFRRWPGLMRWTLLRWLGHALRFIENLFLPTRLLGATRYTLQSQLLPRSFLVVFLFLITLTFVTSNVIVNNARVFDQFGTQSQVTTRDTGGGMRSSYYESLSIPRDRLQPRPMIPAPQIDSDWLPLFLPYAAIIDDPVIAHRCPPKQPPPTPASGPSFSAGDSDEAAIERESWTDRSAQATVACLRKLWRVVLDGKEQTLDGFLPVERADLGLRGIAGWIPLDGEPGPKRLEVIWRPSPEQEQLAEDYVPRRTRHLIPFLWDPSGQ